MRQRSVPAKKRRRTDRPPATKARSRRLTAPASEPDPRRPATGPSSAARSVEPPGRVERRHAILDVAARLFAEIGYADCEMGKLATELGIAKGTLYLYFPSKEELFYACVDSGMRQMQATVQNAANQVTDPLERISRAVHAYLEFFEKRPEQVELLIQERANFKHRKRPTFFDYREAIRAQWRPVYVELQQTGRVRTDLAVERMLENVGNLLYGTMFTNHFAGRTISLADQHSAIMAILFRGILTPIRD